MKIRTILIVVFCSAAAPLVAEELTLEGLEKPVEIRPAGREAR